MQVLPQASRLLELRHLPDIVAYSLGCQNTHGDQIFQQRDFLLPHALTRHSHGYAT